MTTKYAGRARAPEFPEGADWLNTPRPPRLADFAGRLLLLDFWASSSVGCLHLEAILRRLEREFGDDLAVVGVHAPRFDAERATESVRQAVMRCGVAHPVVNDSSMAVWGLYAVRARPTIVFVDPQGKVIGKFEGELTYQQGVDLVAEMLDEFRARGLLPSPPVSPGGGGSLISPPVGEMPEEQREQSEALPPTGMLRYPGGVLADPLGERLFIADTGHHRVLVTAPDGEIQTVIGSGSEGIADGVLEAAQFRGPQGMALSGETLYVADTGNHSIRIVDLEAAIVDTIAGTGAPGAGRVDGGPALTVSLRSPWDLALAGRRLYIAMAGCHQLWMYDLDSGLITAVAGTGVEGLSDGPPEEALLAQPSSVDADEDGVLFFADSASSAIRQADLVTTHEVTTLVGAGLFEFGDADGGAASARMQHPLGVVHEGGVLYVADTYNHRIKRIGLETLQAATLAGDGRPGADDGPFGTARFNEPRGLAVMDGKLYVADTNNHAVRVLDPSTGLVSTLPVDF